MSDLEDEIDELAQLSILEYSQVRKHKAKELGLTRVSDLDAAVKAARKETGTVLPEVVPWHEPVAGPEIANGIIEIIRHYIFLGYDLALTIALFVLHTHAFDVAWANPILTIRSPDKRCGKTSLLSILSMLVNRPLPASNVSSAGIYRAMEAFAPTILFDEIDSYLKGNEEMRGILNATNNRALAFVVRIDGESMQPEIFTVWRPIVLTLIGELPDTVADRSITIELQRKTEAEQVERLRLDRPEAFQVLARKAARWAQDNMDGLDRDPPVPDKLNDRARDCWRPLLAVAQECGLRDESLTAALRLSGDKPDDNERFNVLVLHDLAPLVATEDTSVTTKACLTWLHSLEDRPWVDFGRGAKGLTAHQLARLLKPFGLYPGSVRSGGDIAKGYKTKGLREALKRYAPSGSADLSGTGSQVNDTAAYSPISKRHSEDGVPDGKTPKAAETLGCDVVPDKNPPLGDMESSARVICVQCGEPADEEGSTPHADGLRLHDHCYDDWFKSNFGTTPRTQ